MVDVSCGRPIRVAVLGGGVGSMLTLFELTSEPDWETRYEIAVYQLGWRLGGKGASGRNAHEHMRIEEHGLHMWWGFYDHAFDVMKRCYEELKDETFSLNRCFLPQDTISFMEPALAEGGSHIYELHFPRNAYPPGRSHHSETATLYVAMALRWIDYLRQEVDRRVFAATINAPGAALAIEMLSRLLAVGLSGGGPILEALDQPPVRKRLEALLQQAARWLVEGTPMTLGVTLLARPLRSALEQLRGSLRHPATVHDARDRKQHWYFLWLDFLLTVCIGLLSDGVLLGSRAFVDLDEEELSAWLIRHGLSQTTLSSVLLRGLYDAAFCFRSGDPRLPNIGTGVILKTFIKMFLTYKGSYIWRMAGGMGDIVFAPLYLALKQRAEKAARKRGRPGALTFRFFHRVDKLGLSFNGNEIATITLGEQIRTRNGEYQPLMCHPEIGSPVWPAEPLYEQLVDGDKLRQGPGNGAPYDLESSFCSFPDAASHKLEKGKDFDLVVLGIPLGAIPRCCPELITSSPAWADMVREVQTIRTQAAQLWLREPIAKLGFSGSGLPIVAGFRDPLNSWADMSHTLPCERPPAGTAAPSAVLYFCGPMPDDPAEPPGVDDSYPASQAARVREQVASMLSRHGRELFSRASSGSPPTFSWECLFDRQERIGSERLRAQYVRANIEPSERYILSLAGSTKYRLRPGGSGFANLVLAGDWTRNGIDFGCVESAACSGLQAARAVAERARSLPKGSRLPTDEVSLYRPPFIEVCAMQVFGPPYIIGDMTMQFYAIAADRKRLQAVCDRYLNAVATDWRFEPLGPFLFLIFGHTGINRAVKGPEASYGSGSESSFTVSIPVLRRVSGRTDFGMFPFLAVVDNSLSLASGRELHGFAKSIGWFSGDLTMPGAAVAVETMVFERFTPESRLQRRTLVTVHRKGEAAVAPGDGLRTLLRALSRGGAALPGLAPLLELSEQTVLGAVRDHLEKNDLAIYNLLQLREPQHPSHCRLQVVTRSRFRVTDLRAIGFLPADNKLDLHAYDSHPILAQLTALPPHTQRVAPLAGLWMKMDTIQSSVDEESGFVAGSAATSNARPRLD